MISGDTAAQLREMLEGVLAPGGTASEVEVPGYMLAGKTGTAQKVVDGVYSETQLRRLVRRLRAGRATPSSWSPWSSTSPRATTTAARSRRPAFGEIAKFALPYLGIAPELSRAPRASVHSASIESLAMKLREVLAGAAVAESTAAMATSRSPDLAYDSRAVGRGTLFFCVPGRDQRRARFAPRRGRGRRGRAGRRAAARAGRPAGRRAGRARGDGAGRGARSSATRPPSCDVAGVTGTNGKTTTAFLVRELLEAAGRQCGLLGTVKQVVGGVEEEVERTTPGGDRPAARPSREMLDAGDRACAMEVSSHALSSAPRRRDPLRRRGLHQPHPGPPRLPRRHGGLLRGQAAAVRGRERRARWREAGSVVNVDDPYGRRLAAELRGRATATLVTFSADGRRAPTCARADVDSTPAARASLRTPERRAPVSSCGLPGHFNVANALAALAPPRAPRRRARRRRGARSPTPSRCRAASSRSTRARPSRCSSTTRTRPTRSRTSCGPRGG